MPSPAQTILDIDLKKNDLSMMTTTTINNTMIKSDKKESKTNVKPKRNQRKTSIFGYSVSAKKSANNSNAK